MTITNKTRKILWAKSGGKCAICRIDLAHSDSDEESNHVFGEGQGTPNLIHFLPS